MNKFLLNINQVDRSVVEYYSLCYFPIVNCVLVPCKYDVYLTDNNTVRTCRFCGRQEGSATFKTRAHVIPESVGNRYLLSDYECDSCNKKFSRNLENDYTKFFSFYHNASRIHGKKHVPVYQSNDGITQAKWKKNSASELVYVVLEKTGKTSTFIYPFRKEIVRIGIVDSYTPMAVYKCFIKMALSVMPRHELGAFKDTLNWISDKKHVNIFSGKKLLCRYKMIPGLGTTKYPAFFLYKRTDNRLLIPYMIFHLTYGNFSYLVEVPSLQDMRADILSIPFPPLPFVTTSEGVYDFSGINTVKDSYHSLSYSFDECIPLIENREPVNVNFSGIALK